MSAHGPSQFYICLNCARFGFPQSQRLNFSRPTNKRQHYKLRRSSFWFLRLWKGKHDTTVENKRRQGLVASVLDSRSLICDRRAERHATWCSHFSEPGRRSFGMTSRLQRGVFLEGDTSTGRATDCFSSSWSWSGRGPSARTNFWCSALISRLFVVCDFVVLLVLGDVVTG